jgi:peptidoglycan/xylan/chitin deacetylase (PgdA/CDA1 family)
MEPARYPRDFVGYAGSPPDPRWPGGARLAVNFVVNLEEGGERCVLHGDAASEVRLTDLALSAPVKRRDLLVESAYEYGTRVGFWRLIEAFAERRVPFTTYAVGMAMERNPRIVEALCRLGCDFVDHGWRWFDYAEVNEAVEREHMELSLAAFRRLTGAEPAGWYLGTPSERTRPMRVARGGFLYDSDDYSDELPHWVRVGGRPHLIVPHTLDMNDTRLARGLGWGQADDFTRALRDEFDALYEEGARRPRMMTIGVHARLVGKPARMMHFRRFLDEAMRRPGVWFCRRVEIARHWMTHHPPEPAA